jgi:hypothetical protein
VAKFVGICDEVDGGNAAVGDGEADDGEWFLVGSDD